MNNNFNDTWLQKSWRPMVAKVFMAIIVFDFILAPILWTILSLFAPICVVQWVPMTLQANGIFYISMSAILGVSAYTRGQEKIERVRAEAKIQEEIIHGSKE